MCVKTLSLANRGTTVVLHSVTGLVIGKTVQVNDQLSDFLGKEEEEKKL